MGNPTRARLVDINDGCATCIRMNGRFVGITCHDGSLSWHNHAQRKHGRKAGRRQFGVQYL